MSKRPISKQQGRRKRSHSQDGRDKLLKRDRAVKADFDTAHRDGMEALFRRDMPDLTDALNRENEAVSAHVRLLKKPKPRK
jgi:hypothetical protein